MASLLVFWWAWYYAYTRNGTFRIICPTHTRVVCSGLVVGVSCPH